MKSSGLYGFTGRIKRRLSTILCNLFQKIEEEGKYTNSFYEASITLIAKSGKRFCRSVSFMNLEAIIFIKMSAN